MPRFDPLRAGLKTMNWPAADCLAWSLAVQYEPGRPGWALSGSLSHLAPISVHDLAAGYGLWLAWLRRKGLLDPFAEPAEAVTPENVRNYLREMAAQYAPISVVTRISRLYRAARAVAPTQNWLWLRSEWYRVRRHARAVTDKQSRIVPSAELYACGVDEMLRADRDGTAAPMARALQYRDGLIVALLALRPIRLKNLSRIEIGRNLVRRGASYRLQFDATETKTRYPYEAPLPLELTDYLERYLGYYRPVLGEPAASAYRSTRSLWLSIRGHRLLPNSVYLRVMAVTRKQLGRAINPHAFRAAAATSIAWDAPEHVTITQTVLGHASLSTSENYYNLAQSHKASTRHQDLIFALRNKARSHRDVESN